MTDYKFNLPREVATAMFMACVLLALVMHTIPALLAGLLAFVLTRGLLGALRTRDVNNKLRAHELLAGLIVGIGSIAVLGAVSFLVARLLGGESLREFMLTIADTISHAKKYLPASLDAHVPTSLLELQEMVSNALKAHVNAVFGLGATVLHSLVLTLIGWITGVLAAIGIAVAPAEGDEQPVFYATWRRQWGMLSTSFKNVAWAQAKIAGINALVTGVFLMAVMPAFGWHLPYVKSLILATFVCGLLPVVGNLVSNTLICTMALTVAFPAAVVGGIFLFVSHKLEYFLNARIQGHEIGAKAWELLIVLFAFERLFGPAGMVAAPVIYAFAKADLKRVHWLK
jgi:predicted PurR-regulated permease PerM